MLSVIGFLVILAPLVIVHEFGHFFFAKLFGVKAEAFSVGFGPRIWSRQIGETDFRLSMIPLGGYVKLLGEDSETQLSEDEKKRALQHQPRWKRFWIYFGGPLFNFLFAILIYVAILVIGEPQMASVIGRVEQGSTAYLAGFRSGDRVLEVAGKPVRFFSDMMGAINDFPEQPVSFKVVHQDSVNPEVMTVMTTTEPGFSIYGEAKKVGHIDGIYANPRASRLGVSDPNSAAAKAGLKTWDEVTEFNGRVITNWEVFEVFYRQAASGPIGLKVRTDKGAARDIRLVKPKPSISLEKDLGLYSSELFVEKTVKSSPAERAGITKGDRILSVNGTELRSFFHMKDRIQAEGESKGTIQVAWEHEGKLVAKAIQPTASAERDPILRKTTAYTIGLMPMLALTEAVMVEHRVLNPFTLLYESTSRMLVLSWRNLVSIGKMFLGEVSVGTLGGPILIGKIAGDSLSRGLIAFLSTMAVLSVGLGILNVLPVPVLDGGHIMLLGVETLRRKRLTLRQMEIFQQVGLSLILILMLVVMKNDVMRLPFFN